MHFDFKKLRLTPAESRAIFKKFGWKKMAGFLTRHPLHRPQFEMTINAMDVVYAKDGSHLMISCNRLLNQVKLLLKLVLWTTFFNRSIASSQ